MRALIACTVCWLGLTASMSAGTGFTWQVPVSSALTVGVLYAAASASWVRGWSLVWLLAALYGGIGVVNIQIDVLMLKIAPTLTVARNTVLALAPVWAVSAILAFGITRGRPSGTPSVPPGLAGQLWLRVPAVALLYLVLYVVAGALVLPFIRAFYQSTSLIVVPPLPVLFGVTFLRGLVYVAAIAPLLSRMPARRRQAAVITGLCLAVLGGLAPLLLPNDVLPPQIRNFHIVEVVCENFVFGAMGAFLLARPTASAHRTAIAATV